MEWWLVRSPLPWFIHEISTTSNVMYLPSLVNGFGFGFGMFYQLNRDYIEKWKIIIKNILNKIMEFYLIFNNLI